MVLSCIRCRHAQQNDANIYQSTGTEIFTSTAEELRKFQAAESLKWGHIIKSAGIEAE